MDHPYEIQANSDNDDILSINWPFYYVNYFVNIFQSLKKELYKKIRFGEIINFFSHNEFQNRDSAIHWTNNFENIIQSKVICLKVPDSLYETETLYTSYN